MLKLKFLHRANAIFICLFAIVHIANHLMLVFGANAHIEFMEEFRRLYRIPIVNLALYSAIIFQLFLGALLLIKLGLPKKPIEYLQTLSGIIFSIFIIQHLAATQLSHYFYPTLDTNVYWAAAVVSRAPFSFYFIPYYSLGIMALFSHIGCALYYNLGNKFRASVAALMIAIGVIIAGTIIYNLRQIELPPEYQEYLQTYYIGK